MSRFALALGCSLVIVLGAWVPTSAAVTPFASFTDASGDVRRNFGSAGSEPADAPGVDILGADSRVEDGVVIQSVTFATAMQDGVYLAVTSRFTENDAPSLVVRFRKNVLGAGDGGTLHGADGSSTPIAVDITESGSTAFFRFAESALPQGSCFTMSVWAVLPRGSDVNVGTSDEAFPESDACAAATTPPEPPLGSWAEDGGDPNANADEPDAIPAPGLALALAGVAIAAITRRLRA